MLLQRLIKTYNGPRERVPVWLREIPDYVILSDDALDIWINLRGLPIPDPAILAGERQFRRFRARSR